MALFLGAILCPEPAGAQFGPLEALAANVTDLSFFGGIGRVLPATGPLDSRENTYAFGVELLFEIHSVERPNPEAQSALPSDSIRLTWTRMEVVRSEEGVDTILYYDVQPAPPPPDATVPIWSVELGIGYGQISGFEFRDPSLEFRGSVRDLPAATIYASFEPWSSYFGFRTGFMKTKGLQVRDLDTGDRFTGSSEAFLAAFLLGYAWSVGDFYGFAETAYTARHFPSVEWAGGALPDGIPTELQMSGWSVTAGIQFPIR